MVQVAKPSTALDERPLLGKVLSGLGAATRSARALPEIAYPTVYGATSIEKAQIMATLDSLPLHHVSGVRSIRMVPEIYTEKPNWVIHGRASDLDVTNRIQLSRKTLITPDKMARTLTHEVGHTVDYESQTFGLFGERSTEEPFGRSPYVTEYAKTNHREDFAESFEEYFSDPENLKDKAPEKHQAVKDMSDPGFIERLVDRKEFRETGKYVAETFGGSEISRHAAQGAYVASAALQGIHGLSQWIRSSESGDSMGHASGVLNAATGLSFMAGVNPLLGMGLQGANHALQGAVSKGQLSAAEVESAVTFPVRPLEVLFGRKLAKIEDGHRPGKVLAVATGGALGGATGSFIGPYLGVLGGYHVAGGLGGAVGMVAGGMLGFLAGAEVGGRIAARLAV
jgi:hypothetical protein